MRICIITPPMSQLNTPYASLPALNGILRAAGHDVHCWDASIDLALQLYAPDGLRRCFDAIAKHPNAADHQTVLLQRERYIHTVAAVIRFLQGKDTALAGRIVRQAWLPQGPRFTACDAEAEQEAFGIHGQHDHARWLCTLYVQDIADTIRATIAPHFGLTSYGESIAMSASSYDPLAQHLASPPDPVEHLLLASCAAHIPVETELVLLSAPFPGNMASALRIAQWLRHHRPQCKIALGGGYPSTELRQLREPRIFDVVDYIPIDEASRNLPSIIAHCNNTETRLSSCFTRDATHGAITWHPPHEETRFAHQAGPSYSGISLNNYLDLLDTWNPMQRLWNEGRWLKLTAAQGCYWKRCTFCDTSLPYIADYQPLRATDLADRMDALHQETGQLSFHFTDEAAPPQLMLGLALELIRRGRSYHWWGNVRFDPQFTADRCRVLAAGGMIAVSGGLEVAHDRLLDAIGKGVSIEQAFTICGNFAQAGILVHAYLMYGFPGQNAQDTIDALEVVRQLFATGRVHSGFWHRFTATAHSPIGHNPDHYQIELADQSDALFAVNNIPHQEPNGFDHNTLSDGLHGALHHYCQHIGLEEPVTSWFDHQVPQVSRPLLQRLQQLSAQNPQSIPGKRACWLGGLPQHEAICDELGDCWPTDAATGARLAGLHPSAWQKNPPNDTAHDLAMDWHERGLVWI